MWYFFFINKLSPKYKNLHHVTWCSLFETKHIISIFEIIVKKYTYEKIILSIFHLSDKFMYRFKGI